MHTTEIGLMRIPEFGKTWLGNVSLSAKASLVVALLLALFLVAMAGTSLVLDQEGAARLESDKASEMLQQITQAIRSLYQRQYELREFLTTTSEPDTKAFDQVNILLSRQLQNIAALRASDPLLQIRIDRIDELNLRWTQSVSVPLIAGIRQLWRNSSPASAIDRERVFQDIARRATVQTADLIHLMDQLADSVRSERAAKTKGLLKTESLRQLLVYGTLTAALLFGGLAIILSLKLITVPLRHLSRLMTRLAAHDHEIEINYLDRRDEVGVIAKALAKFKTMVIETSDENWIKTSFATVSNRLQQVDTVEAFANALLAETAPLLTAGVAIFYSRTDGRDRLELSGSYGFDGDAPGAASYRIGEGLVGQCAAERKPIFLESLPQDYIRIRSGIGEASPRQLALLPIVAKDKLMAVIEFGLLAPLEPRQRRLLDALAPMVSLSLENILRALHTRDLLTQTQAQANELRASEEELRAQQEELQTSNEELRLKSDTLNQQKATLETLQRETQEKAEALTRANQYKTEFLANMSHELRTPLNSLLILSNDLAENGSGNLQADQVESARIIHESGSNLLRLINDILDLSKIEAGKMELLLEPIHLERFAARIKRSFDRLALQKQVAFSVTIDDGLPAAMVGDGNKLEQVVGNLLSNAFKFTRQGSVRLRIGRPLNSQRGFPADDTIAIEVTDTGIGIPADKRDKIFGAFEQVDASTSRQFGGTGLGLAISRQLVRLHHGEFLLQSEPGQGSVFTVLLPPTQPAGTTEPSVPGGTSLADAVPVPTATLAAAEAPADDRDQVAPGEATILAIEDDPAFARILIDLIRHKGYRALAAMDGESGLALARQYRPIGILLDVMLPRMDGWSVIEHLKADPLVRHIPVHFISALDESARGREVGAVGFLTKPVTAEALAGALERLQHFSAGTPRRLLVIDDDAAARAAVRKLIASDQVEVLEAASAEEALVRLDENGFDCIVLDLALPGMSGFDFLEKISASHPSLPVVVYSARELSREDSLRLRQHTDSIVIKGTRSPERLIDEVSLFLHSIRRSGSPNPDTANDLSGRKVLIVDDDMRNVFALSRILRAKGLDVSLAQDGQKALKVLGETGDIELVLMDVMMPIMDGHEAIREIRKNPRFAHLPIIALTAKAMSGDREKSLAAGANDYLPKPIDVAKLLSMVRVWLHR